MIQRKTNNIIRAFCVTAFLIQTMPVLAVHEVSSVEELIKNADRLNGKVVRVKGFYTQKAPDIEFYPDRKAFKERDLRYLLWVGNYHPKVPESERQRCTRCDVVVTGLFIDEELGVFGGYKGQIQEVEKFEIVKRYSTSTGSSMALRLRKRIILRR